MIGTKFNTRHNDTSRSQPERHGLNWTDEDYYTLSYLFHICRKFELICMELKRTPAGVIPKLRALRLIEPGSSGSYSEYVYAVAPGGSAGHDAGWLQAIRRARENPCYTPGELFKDTRSPVPSLVSFPPSPPFTEENTMSDDNQKIARNTPVIEDRTYIAGQNAAEMSIDQIFGLIAKLEDRIATLSKIKVVSKAVRGSIERIEADVVKLAAYADSREA